MTRLIQIDYTAVGEPGGWSAGPAPSAPLWCRTMPPASAKQRPSVEDRALLRQWIEAGAPALVAGETAGEASTLSAAEQEFLIRAAVEIAHGRARVIAGRDEYPQFDDSRRAVGLLGHD